MVITSRFLFITSSTPWEWRWGTAGSRWARQGRSGFCGALPKSPRIGPDGRHDACFLTRSSHVTGEIHVHEMAWAGEELWLVNTAFSCLCTLDVEHSFVPRWRPPFVSALAAEDRCHLNGLALEEGRPRYVTAMSETDTREGWRQQGDARVLDRCPERRDGRPWVRDAAFAPRPPGSGLDAGFRSGPAGDGRSHRWESRGGLRAAGLHPRSGDGRPAGARRFIEDPRNLDLRRRAGLRASP